MEEDKDDSLARFSGKWIAMSMPGYKTTPMSRLDPAHSSPVYFFKIGSLFSVLFGAGFEIVSLTFGPCNGSGAHEGYSFVKLISSDEAEILAFKDMHARSLSELLVKLELNNAIFDEPRMS